MLLCNKIECYLISCQQTFIICADAKVHVNSSCIECELDWKFDSKGD